MVEERVVVATEWQQKNNHQGVWVEGIQQSACNACSAKSACGQHSLSKLGRKVKLWLETEESLKQGEEIIIGLPEGALAKSAMVLYGLPLLSMLIFAIIGESIGAVDDGAGWLPADLSAIIFGVSGLVIGFALAKIWTDKNQHQWQPTFLRRCSIQFTAIE